MDTGDIAYNHDGTAVLIGSRTQAEAKTRGAGALCVRSGGWFYPLEPTPENIRIEDIAHALSMICRYTGHVSEFWSVAAHSIEVSKRVFADFVSGEDGGFLYQTEGLEAVERAARKIALTALLHDASEAYLVDVPRGLKNTAAFAGYKQHEAALERAVSERFGLEFPFPAIVKKHDDSILVDEIANFFDPGSGLWSFYDITRREDYPRLLPLEPKLGFIRFMQRFEELTA